MPTLELQIAVLSRWAAKTARKLVSLCPLRGWWLGQTAANLVVAALSLGAAHATREANLIPAARAPRAYRPARLIPARLACNESL